MPATQMIYDSSDSSLQHSGRIRNLSFNHRYKLKAAIHEGNLLKE
jgi:hypothetical protein